ncbi:MAG: glucosamine-6-phosphate deaminase [Rubrobacteraceae bacterium]
MRVRVLPDYEAMSAAAAATVARTLRQKPDAVFLLPTGTTPLVMYRQLAELHATERLSFADTTFFNLDEYLGLPPDHPASYHVYMRDHFYSFVDANPDRFQVPAGDARNPQAECERYEAAIRDAGGVDLCVLGIGRNGHIGFNEPGASFDSRTRVVRLAETTRLVNAADFEGDRAPERAITVGMKTIFESREILLLASGANKADAVAETLYGTISPDVPASMLSRHRNTTLMLDLEAAALVEEAPE